MRLKAVSRKLRCGQDICLCSAGTATNDCKLKAGGAPNTQWGKLAIFLCLLTIFVQVLKN